MNTILKIAAFAGMVVSTQVVAQSEIDVLRYSQQHYTGTARASAMGGAFGALGADFSVLSTNPAGIGMYKKSEFVLTPNIDSSFTSATYQKEMSSDSRYNIGFNNYGMVLAFNTSKKSQENGWMNIQFAFGMNKTATFNNRINIEGNNIESSIMDVYYENAKGKTPSELNEFDTKLAWDAFLLDDPDTLGYVSYYTPFDGHVKQSKSITQRGAINEMVFTLGGNYKDFIYLGATIGVPYLRYVERSTYEEVELDNWYGNDFESLKIQDIIRTTGTGINLKLGMIVRPTDWLRLGGALHTPSYFYLDDSFKRTLSAAYTNEFASYSNNEKINSPQNLYNFSVVTPMRAIGSVAFVLGDKGLISADYELVNYPEAGLYSGDEGFNDENDAIASKYVSQKNLRIGGELNLNPIMLRAGYNLYGSPFKNEDELGVYTSYSLGFGYRKDNYFYDFAYVISDYSENYNLYSFNEKEYNAKLNIQRSKLVFTVGARF